MVDSRLDEIAGDISFVVPTAFGRPAFMPAGGIAEGIGCLQIAVGFLGGQYDGYPFLQGGLHLFLVPK